MPICTLFNTISPVSPQRGALVEYTLAPTNLFNALVGMTDFDDDGFSSLLGGSDCDGLNPEIHPRGLDIPGDGVDQNCSGADADLNPGTGIIALPVSSGPSTGYRVLWIIVDSLRYDRMAQRTRGRDLTPALDAFSSNCAVFENARAQSDNTRESIPSMLSSQYPSYFLRMPSERKLNHSLAEVLKAAGYHTGLISPVTDLPDFSVAGFDAIERSFSHKKNYIYGVTSGPVTQTAADLLKHWRDEKFFLVVHYFDPHGAYIPHQHFYFGDSNEDRYDSEVAYTDGAVGMLLNLIEENGFLDDTIVIINADHGDSFGEHGNLAHGNSLYEEVIHVPLLMYVPNHSPRAINHEVGLIDLMPTVIDLLALPDPGRLQGRSLRPLLSGEPLPPAPVFFDSNFKGRMLRGVVKSGFKLVVDYDWNIVQLFDLSEDPEERRNLARSNQEMKEELFNELNRFRDCFLDAPLFRGPPNQ